MNNDERSADAVGDATPKYHTPSAALDVVATHRPLDEVFANSPFSAEAKHFRGATKMAGDTANILAEMRHCLETASPRQRYAPKISLRAWSNLADRIEAAVRREIRAERASGNAVDLREALWDILDVVYGVHHEEPTPRSVVDSIKKIVFDALDAPARNCDVGTAEEQSERFAKVCKANSKDGVRGLCSETCPLNRDYQSECALAWAQMPYREGGAG